MKDSLKIAFSVVMFCLTTLSVFAQTNSFTDPRDGQVYRTVTIGDQTWMAENLRFETENSKALRVKKNKYQIQFDGSFKGANECGTTDEYGTKAIFCEHLEKVGRYYPWEDASIACPADWHLSTSEEWEKLFDYVTETKGPFKNKTPMSQSKDYFVGVAKILKSKYWVNEPGLKDELGFSVMPDGHSKYDKVTLIGIQAQFWTATPLIYKSGEKAKGYYMYIDFPQFGENAFREDGLEGNGRSVRCVKDK